MNTSDYIQLGILIITAGSVTIALIAIRSQILWSNKQMRLNFFSEYTKRYQDIILHLPLTIHSQDFDLKKLKDFEPDKYDKTLRYMKVYFDLCSEELY